MITIPGSPLSMTFFDAADRPIANGRITLRLNTDAVLGGQQISAGIVVNIDLDSTGSFSSDAVLANEDMSPSTVYFAKVYTSQGQLAWEDELFVTVPK